MSDSPASVAVDALSRAVTEGIVGVEFLAAAIAGPGPEYFALIDLNNGNSVYKHVESGSVQIAAFSGAIEKASVSAQWNARLGVILAIDSSEVTIGFLDAASIKADNSNSFTAFFARNIWPLTLSLASTAGDFDTIVTNSVVTSTELTTASTIPDATPGGGGTVTPEVGDVIVRVERTAGTGTASVIYTAQYRTVP